MLWPHVLTPPTLNMRVHKGLFVTNQKPLCSFVSFVVKFKLLIRNLHLVNENTVCSRGAVAIELHGIRELVIHRAGEKRVVRNVHRHPHAVDGKRVMQYGVSNGVIVVFGHNMVPCSGSEARKRDAGSVPAFQAVVKNAPLIAGIKGLPAEVVDPSVQNLLAFKLNGLWQSF
jgi:hypothetical protein